MQSWSISAWEALGFQQRVIDVLGEVERHLGTVAVKGNAVGPVLDDLTQLLGVLTDVGSFGERSQDLSRHEFDESVALETRVTHGSLLA